MVIYIMQKKKKSTTAQMKLIRGTFIEKSNIFID